MRMKLTDKLTQMIGQDKLLHLLVAALFVSQFDDYGFWFGLLALIVVSGFSYAKEKLLDKTEDWEDMQFAVLGGVLELIFYTFHNLIF